MGISVFARTNLAFAFDPRRRPSPQNQKLDGSRLAKFWLLRKEYILQMFMVPDLIQESLFQCHCNRKIVGKLAQKWSNISVCLIILVYNPFCGAVWVYFGVKILNDLPKKPYTL